MAFYEPFVRKLAYQQATRLPRMVDAEDLVQWGAFGLATAIDRFDPARNIKFATFAARRIVGAMLDGLRDIDWVPRLERRRAKSDAKRMVSISSSRDTTDGAMVASIAMSTDEHSASLLLSVDDLDAFEAIIRPLDSSKRDILRHMYVDGLNLRETGEHVGLSMSRISQIHSLALLELKAEISRTKGDRL